MLGLTAWLERWHLPARKALGAWAYCLAREVAPSCQKGATWKRKEPWGAKETWLGEGLGSGRGEAGGHPLVVEAMGWVLGRCTLTVKAGRRNVPLCGIPSLSAEPARPLAPGLRGWGGRQHSRLFTCFGWTVSHCRRAKVASSGHALESVRRGWGRGLSATGR